MPGIGLAIPQLALRRLGTPASPPSGTSASVDRTTVTVDTTRLTSDRS